jgi:hypothetical protein
MERMTIAAVTDAAADDAAHSAVKMIDELGLSIRVRRLRTKSATRRPGSWEYVDHSMRNGPRAKDSRP